MPRLSPERWRVVSPHLDHALDLSDTERAAWLAALRSEDAALAADLEASLAGLVVGACTLRAPLGHGGMATPARERAAAGPREQFGDGDWRTAEPRLALGLRFAAAGQYARAEPLLGDAHARLLPRRRAQPRLVQEAATSLARVQEALGRREPPTRDRTDR